MTVANAPCPGNTKMLAVEISLGLFVILVSNPMCRMTRLTECRFPTEQSTIVTMSSLNLVLPKFSIESWLIKLIN